MTNTPNNSGAGLSQKVLEIKALVETARWSLLDAVVMLNDLYADVIAVPVEDERPVLAPDENHEDYTPSGDEG